MSFRDEFYRAVRAWLVDHRPAECETASRVTAVTPVTVHNRFEEESAQHLHVVWADGAGAIHVTSLPFDMADLVTYLLARERR